MNQLFLIGTVGLAVLVGLAEPSMAKPKKLTWQCTCTCVAYDPGGRRHEGGKLTFDTTGPGACAIGIQVGCQVGELQGAYAACYGTSSSTHVPLGTGGVATGGGSKGPVQPKANPPTEDVQQPVPH